MSAQERLRPSIITSSGAASEHKESRAPKIVLAVGAAMCALCCSAPLFLAAGIGGASLAAFAAHAETIATVLLVLAGVTYVVLRYRARNVIKDADVIQQGAACSVDCASRPSKQER